jgi:hypothetical protein
MKHIHVGGSDVITRFRASTTCMWRREHHASSYRWNPATEASSPYSFLLQPPAKSQLTSLLKKNHRETSRTEGFAHHYEEIRIVVVHVATQGSRCHHHGWEKNVRHVNQYTDASHVQQWEVLLVEWIGITCPFHHISLWRCCRLRSNTRYRGIFRSISGLPWNTTTTNTPTTVSDLQL